MSGSGVGRTPTNAVFVAGKLNPPNIRLQDILNMSLRDIYPKRKKMKKTDLEKLRSDLEKGFGKRTMRFGIEYAWYNAHALDAGIQTRARKARRWREEVLKLSESGEVSEERVKVRMKYVGMKRPVMVTAYYVDGELAFYRKGGNILKPEDYERIE